MQAIFGNDRLDGRQLANLGVLAATVTVFFAMVEVGLCVSGFSYILHPEEIEFGNPDPVTLKSGFL
jgi:hypothetical protein